MPALAAFAGGALSTCQSRANAALATTVDDALTAALWSFGSGWLVLTLGLLLPGPRAGLRAVVVAWRSRRIAGWHCLAGMLGGLFVATQSFVVPQIGVALFTIAVVAGQTGGALLVDRWGLGPGGRTPVTAQRLAAAGVALAGVSIAVGGRIDAAGPAAMLVVAGAACVGAATSVQMAANGRVNRAAGRVMATTWLNFTTGLIVLAVFVVVRACFRVPLHPLAGAVEPWMLTGGVLGIVFVAVNAVVVHRLGVLTMMLASLAGQLVGAVALDVLSPTAAGGLTPALLVGVAVTMVAAMWAGISASGAGRRLTRGRMVP